MLISTDVRSVIFTVLVELQRILSTRMTMILGALILSVTNINNKLCIGFVSGICFCVHAF